MSYERTIQIYWSAGCLVDLMPLELICFHIVAVSVYYYAQRQLKGVFVINLKCRHTISEYL